MSRLDIFQKKVEIKNLEQARHFRCLGGHSIFESDSFSTIFLSKKFDIYRFWKIYEIQ